VSTIPNLVSNQTVHQTKPQGFDPLRLLQKQTVDNDRVF
jgi:hypothetical protein